MDFVLRPRRGRFEPNADVFVDEAAGRILVKVELSGAEPESVQVELTGRRLTITGQRTDRSAWHRGSFVQKEIAYGDFLKELVLPVAVAHEELVAEYLDGMLVIALPISTTEFVNTINTELTLVVTRTRP